MLGIRQRMRNCENEIALISNQIQQTQQEILCCIQNIAQIEIPQSGSSLALSEVYSGKRALIRQMEDSNLLLSSLKSQLKDKQEEYKGMQLEFEKIKYLQQREVSAILDKHKRKESQELDEIATMLFVQQGGKT